MSAYEELLERCAADVWLAEAKRAGMGRRLTEWADESEDTHDRYRPLAAAVLAEVLRTLETVTPEMNAAIKFRAMPRPTWLAMLRASPLAPNCGGITS